TPAEDTAEGRLLLNVSGVIAEFEREKIRERTLRGNREKARRGLVVAPGHSPFGYKPEQGRLVIDERQAAVVREIYRLLIDERRSVRGIVTDLNRRGVASARGPWNTTQLRRVLSDERYIGRARYGDIVIPIPAIVTPDEHTAARAQLDRNRAQHVGRPAQLVDLLKGLLRCSACGYKYRGGPTSGGRRCYKHDADRARVAACTRRFYFAAATVEADVLAAITAALQDPAVLRQGVEAYETRRGATDVELHSRVAHLQKQIAGVRADDRRLIALVVGDREQQDLVESKLRELARQRGALAEQLRAAEAKVAQHGAVNRTDVIERLCAQARRGLARLDGKGWRRWSRRSSTRSWCCRTEVWRFMAFSDRRELGRASRNPCSIRAPGGPWDATAGAGTDGIACLRAGFRLRRRRRPHRARHVGRARAGGRARDRGRRQLLRHRLVVRQR
ncbi:MAG TPA: recombinase family protein, partial [Solirubrobacteraceae bacterium]